MMQKINLHIAAFILLLAIFQKLGLELWLHHWLHEPSQTHQIARENRDKASLQSAPVSCSCLDDTLMPLIQSETYTCQDPLQRWVSIHLPPYVCTVYGCREFPSLRGPPAGGIA